MKFISLGEWFDQGTEATLIEEFPMESHMPAGRWGLFEGIREGGVDQEVCLFDEFIITES